MDKQYRIVIGRFSEESNSFNPLVCDLADFLSGNYLEGDDVIGQNRGLPTMISGIIDAIEQRGGICIPSVHMNSRSSGGAVAQDAVDYFLDKIFHCIDAQPAIDGVFLALHGATQGVEESNEDVCGYILSRIREKVGADVVVTVGCDLHANITETMLKNADFISGYQTYPHVDLYQTGYRSASMGMHKLMGGAPLYTARVPLPMIVPASGYSNTCGAFKEVMDFAHDMAEKYKVCDFSVFQMQPWLDVKDASSSVLVIAEDADIAAKMAREVAQKLFEERDNYWPKLTPVNDIIRRAYENKQQGKPVVLVDMADSPNGGAVADSVAAVVGLMELDLPVSACTVVRDAAATAKAFEIGVGGEAEFTFGATLTPGDVPGPVTVKARVVSLHDGIFKREGPASRFATHMIGHAAVITFGQITVLLCERPAGTGDLQIYRHFGIEPTFYDLVVVKANTSFRGGYEPVAAEIWLADTPGACTANLTSLPFERIEKSGFYPFEHLDDFVIPQATIY